MENEIKICRGSHQMPESGIGIGKKEMDTPSFWGGREMDL
jgi:hypothetical protein